MTFRGRILIDVRDLSDHGSRKLLAAQQPGTINQRFKMPLLSQAVGRPPLITRRHAPEWLRYYVRENTTLGPRELRLVVKSAAPCSQTKTARTVPFSSAHELQRHSHFPNQQIAGSCGRWACALARTLMPTRLLRNRVQLQIPNDDSNGDCPFVAHSRRLDAQRSLRACGDRQGTGRVFSKSATGPGGRRRLQELQFPVLLKGSRYRSGWPIGKPEIIQNFTTSLKQFYLDWYRPY